MTEKTEQAVPEAKLKAEQAKLETNTNDVMKELIYDFFLLHQQMYLRKFLVSNVESCPPVEILKAWDRYRLTREVKEDSMLTKDKVLKNLMSFLRHEVEGEEHRVLAEIVFGNGMERKDTHKPVHRNEPTATTLIANSSAGKNNRVFCDPSHLCQ
ncbi:transposable element Tc1 transposase [Caerostris darwini]|uniref:Transposable element Tc1 transposase n=1 Tax=Caerostris darwini TaxID=1538125 RepID=A0AAV4W345_9ARAC|nr:transposable element Tc1 transposase [Caerostris darwini]